MNSYSDDLKAATDSLPSAVSAVLLGAIFGFSLGTTWFDILTGVSFRNVNDRKVRFEDRERGWFFTKGQPLGFYSSWPVFALTHHALVWLAASKAYPGTVFQDYAILGDDLVIADSKVAREYVRLMDCLKVTISKEKSLISSTGACEFAKKFLTEGGRVDLSPVSLKVVNLFGGFVPAIHYLLLGVNLRTSVRLRGGGFRSYSVPEGVRPPGRKWMRHWLNYLLAKLRSLRSQTGLPVIGLWITAPSYGALCPSRFGVAHHSILMSKKPKPLDARAFEKMRSGASFSKFCLNHG